MGCLTYVTWPMVQHNTATGDTSHECMWNGMERNK